MKKVKKYYCVPTVEYFSVEVEGIVCNASRTGKEVITNTNNDVTIAPHDAGAGIIIHKWD